MTLLVSVENNSTISGAVIRLREWILLNGTSSWNEVSSMKDLKDGHNSMLDLDLMISSSPEIEVDNYRLASCCSAVLQSSSQHLEILECGFSEMIDDSGSCSKHKDFYVLLLPVVQR